MKRFSGNLFVKIATYSVLILGAVFILLPFVWMVLTAVKPSNEVLMMPPKWIPSKIQWENFSEAFQSVPFVRYFLNSVIVTVCITVCELLTTILAAFAFSQLEFKGKQFLFLILVATMMVPGEILVIPNFVTLAKLGWINTYRALIAPWGASVFSIFLLRQQFASIPKAYYQAARIDGCPGFTLSVFGHGSDVRSDCRLGRFTEDNQQLEFLSLAADCNQHNRNAHPACGTCLFLIRGRHTLQHPDGIFPDDDCPHPDCLSVHPEIYHSWNRQNRIEGINQSVEQTEIPFFIIIF